MAIFPNNRKENIVDVKFEIHKFTDTNKPADTGKIIIVSSFSEFGCEVLTSLYCLPRIKKDNPDAYIIVMGWYGRSYLYKHLADEFWELKEDYQWLRDYTLAFHHNSKNLKKIEKIASSMGRIITADSLGRIAVGNTCNECQHFWGQVEGVEKCPKCQNRDITKALFADVRYWRQRITRLPAPSTDKINEAKKYIGTNPVGITARNRATYGRNLQPEFYVKLIEVLQKRGYTPIWLGEKQTTYACPVPGIVDLTRMSEARDLELTLAVVSQLKFTMQFWTASTRLAALTGTPYLLFESPDQLFGQGQEAYRLALCTTGSKKLVLCHYLNVFNDNDKAIDLINSCISQMEIGDWNDVIGMVEEPMMVASMRKSNLHRLGGI